MGGGRIMTRGRRFGGWFRKDRRDGEAGGTGGTEGEERRGRPLHSEGGEGLVHRFAAAWARVRAALGAVSWLYFPFHTCDARCKRVIFIDSVAARGVAVGP